MNPKTEARILGEIARARAGDAPPHLPGDRTPVETRTYTDERRFAPSRPCIELCRVATRKSHREVVRKLIGKVSKVLRHFFAHFFAEGV